MSSTDGRNGKRTATPATLERNFTHRFLRSLRRLTSSPDAKPTAPTTHAVGMLIRRRRSLRIKRAAYSSMARAVGSHRAWSRALLSRPWKTQKLKIEPISSGAATIARIRTRRPLGVLHPDPPARRRKSGKRATAVSLKKNVVWKQRREPNRAGKLRELVPGGSRMEMSELLEETAHYVQCLAVQVRVMQAVADHYSI